ncbi:uncharacterized protein LOC126886829 [Diabrotica virgifera virgifera]|uniref:BTB domain-containing protein n=1 Tax=Diabrotica virgifera virgifera TaxID=50390 RepID=A0ABM5KIC5_DIAVI|nr:uncharacterized protein LOC126886829 [Diabrotica virgifera virgifera]
MPRISSEGKITRKEKLYNMYLNREMVDTEIILKDGQISAHSLVLAAASPMLYGMLEPQIADLKTVALRQYSKLIMRYILEYLYKGDFLCPKDEETEFKAAAEFLQLEGLHSNRQKQTVKQEPSTSQKVETVTLQEPIVIADDSDSSNIEPNQKDTHPRKKIKLNSTASRCSARPRRRFVISDSSSSDEELEDSLDFLIREAKQRSATRDKNERDNSFKEQSKKLMNIIRSQKNKMNTIPESTADSSLVLLESPPSIIEIYEESVPVQQEDLGSSETLMIHTDATQNSPNVEPSQRPCRNEQPLQQEDLGSNETHMIQTDATENSPNVEPPQRPCRNEEPVQQEDLGSSETLMIHTDATQNSPNVEPSQRPCRNEEPVQQEDLGSSETLMIHTDATQNSPNVEPSQRPCRNEQPLQQEDLGSNETHMIQTDATENSPNVEPPQRPCRNEEPVQQEDLGSSETLMIHTDATQNSPNVEPSQRPCRNEQPEAETIPPNIEEETRPPKRGFWRTRHNSKKFGRNFCAICYKSRRGIKRHIKLNHRHLTRKPYFRCSRCLRNFYYESVYEYHKENGCNRE